MGGIRADTEGILSSRKIKHRRTEIWPIGGRVVVPQRQIPQVAGWRHVPPILGSKGWCNGIQGQNDESLLGLLFFWGGKLLRHHTSGISCGIVPESQT